MMSLRCSDFLELKRLTLFVKFIYALQLGLFASQIFAAELSEYQISRWPDSKTAAVSITLDDNLPGQFSFGLPELTERGMAATFYVITSKIDWGLARGVASLGHEIGSHSVSHPDMTLDPNKSIMELFQSRLAVQVSIPRHRCATFAWPYSKSSELLRNAAAASYIASRSSDERIESFSPADLHKVSSVCMDRVPAARLRALVDSVRARGGWLVLLYHEIDEAEGGASTPAGLFGEHLDVLNENRSDLWIAPFGTVARYIRERDCARITPVRSAGVSLKLALRDTLDNATFNVPLSMRIRLPLGWPDATVRNLGKVVSATHQADRWLEFNAIPDEGDITLSLSPTTSVGDSHRMSTPRSGRDLRSLAAEDFSLQGRTMNQPRVAKIVASPTVRR